MSLILCGRRAESPYRHERLNLNIWSEQELCYLIERYPLLWTGEILGFGLFGWIETELGRKDLAETLISMKRSSESDDAMLSAILRECNFCTASEIESFAKKFRDYRRFSGAELVYMEGRALYSSGNLSAACDLMEEAVKRMESDFRKNGGEDAQKLKAHNERKADIFADMASLRMQLFDESGAVKLLETSLSTFHTGRAARLLYLIDGSGDLSDKEKKELDQVRDRARMKARESEEYREVKDMFELRDEELYERAGALAASWKNVLRTL